MFLTIKRSYKYGKRRDENESVVLYYYWRNGPIVIDQGSSDFFCKGPNNKYLTSVFVPQKQP